MGTILASALISKARYVLNDTGTRYTDAELLGWLNDAQRDIATLRTDATSRVGVKQLSAGTLQTIPNDGLSLVRLTRYMGTNGSTPGSAVRQVTHDLMDNNNPAWHSDTPAAAPDCFIFNPVLPRQFYVYPPNTGTGYVELIYNKYPVDIASTANNIDLDNMYANQMVDYVLYRAFSKDDGDGGNEQRAAAYMQLYRDGLGLGAQAAMQSNTAG